MFLINDIRTLINVVTKDLTRVDIVSHVALFLGVVMTMATKEGRLQLIDAIGISLSL